MSEQNQHVAPEAQGLGAGRLEQLQALRDDVRRKLAASARYGPGGAYAHAASYLRVECLLEEGDELQRAYDYLAARLATLEAAGAGEAGLPWVKIEPGNAETYPEDHGYYDFANQHRIYFSGYFGSSRFGVGSWYERKEDDEPPYRGIDGVTYWRQQGIEPNPNDLATPVAPAPQQQVETGGGRV